MPKVLKQMGKPPVEVYDTFCEKYKRVNERLGLKQYVVPYFISSHPGCDTASAIRLAQYMHCLLYTSRCV